MREFTPDEMTSRMKFFLLDDYLPTLEAAHKECLEEIVFTKSKLSSLETIAEDFERKLNFVKSFLVPK